MVNVDAVMFCVIQSSKNGLESLEVEKNLKLSELKCSDNKLASLDIGNNKLLHVFDCSNNKLTSVDVSQNKLLTKTSHTDTVC